MINTGAPASSGGDGGCDDSITDPARDIADVPTPRAFIPCAVPSRRVVTEPVTCRLARRGRAGGSSTHAR
eukprot:m.598103 g.598103  ORF g.598103 m.598103 type:complete len:70 (-) comp22418_c2_seq37:1068-1277(-)